MINYIIYAVGVIFLLFILAGLIWGGIRGLKKTSFRAIWLIVTLVVLFFITPLVTRALMDVDISVLNLTIADQSVSSLNNLTVQLLQQVPDFGGILTHDTVIDIMLTLATLLINAFVFVILFWLAKILLWPLWAIISKNMFGKKKIKNEKPQKKHAALGMLVGGLLGIFIGAITLMPLIGIANTVLEIEEKTQETYMITVTNDIGEQEDIEVTTGQIAKLGGDEFIEMLKLYQNSFVGKAFKYSGVNAFVNVTCSGLSTATINNERVGLKGETTNILLTIGSIKTLQLINFDNFTQEKISLLIDTSRTLIDRLFNVKSFSALGDQLLSGVIDEVLDNPDFVIQLPKTGQQLVDKGIVDSVENLRDITFEIIKNDMIRLLNMAEILNDINFYMELSNTDEIDKIFNLIDQQTFEDITKQLFEMYSVTYALPVFTDVGFNYLAKELKLEDFEINSQNLSNDAIKQFFKALTDTSYAIYNTLDFDKENYVTQDSFALLGRLLDTLKNYEAITAENYALLINAVENKAHEWLSELLKENIPAEFNDVITEVLSCIYNLSEVENFEAELTTVGNAYEKILYLEGSVVEDNTAQKLGELLDILKLTKICGNNINNIAVKLIDYAQQTYSSQLADFNDIITSIKQNISSVDGWEVEMQHVDALLNMAEKIDVDNIEQEVADDDSDLFNEIGEVLNNLKNSKLFGGEVNNVVKILLDKVATLQISGVEYLDDSFEIVKSNINNASVINWQTELQTLKSFLSNLLNLKDDSNSETLEIIGEQLNVIVAKNSVLIDEKVINSMLKSVITNFAGDVEGDYELLVNKFLNSLDNVTLLNYKQELVALNSLFTELNGFNMEELNLEIFGELLDSYDKDNGSMKSKLISPLRNDIVTFAIDKIDTLDMDEDVVEIINKIKNNVSEIESYKLEFKHLANFIDLVDLLKSIDVETFSFVEVGGKLDAYSTSKLIKNVRADVLNLVVDNVEITTEYANIESAISEILINTKLVGASVDDTTITFSLIFTEFSELKDKLSAFDEIVITKENYNVGTYGEKLNNLNTLTIVPTTSCAKIAVTMIDVVVGEEGILSLLPENYESQELSALIGVCNEKRELYNDFIANGGTDEFNFAQDFADIDTKLNDLREFFD